MALLLLYADDVRTSQEAQTSTACYGDSFYFYYFLRTHLASHLSQVIQCWVLG
jgi:hypothetical protein